MPSDGASMICNMRLKLAKSAILRLGLRKNPGLRKNFKFSAKKISFLGLLDLGESKQPDSGGPPFQRPIFLKFSSQSGCLDLKKKSRSVRIMSTLSEEPHSAFDNSSTDQWKPLNFGVLVQNLI